MRWDEQEDGRGNALIGAVSFPLSDCSLVRMHGAGSISGAVFGTGDVMWIPKVTVPMYPCTALDPKDFAHRVDEDLVPAEHIPDLLTEDQKWAIDRANGRRLDEDVQPSLRAATVELPPEPVTATGGGAPPAVIIPPPPLMEEKKGLFGKRKKS